MNKYVYLPAIAILALLLLVSSSQPVGCQPKTITILHTNDMHAAFLPHEAFWIQSDPKPMVGGFQELSWMVDSVRKAKGEVLFLDGGDIMTGTPIAEFNYKNAMGGALFEMMNLLGYDAWTIGNHDLDISQENLRHLIGLLKFPTTSANLTDSAGAFPFGNKRSVIVQKNGMRIGIIGIMSRDLYRLTNTNNLRGLKVLPPAETAQPIIDSLRAMTDLIVALTHEGVDDDSLLAASTHGLNVIIGAHSHTRLKAPKNINGVIICQTGSSCENLGDLELTVENHQVTKYDGRLLPLWARHEYPDNDLGKLVNDCKSKVDHEYGEVLGTLATDWKRAGKGETNLGDFIADAMREGGDGQIGVTNSSGIRTELRAGPITKLDLFEIVPFRNTLCTFAMSGKELRDFAQRNAQSVLDGRSSLQISGLTCTWKNVGGKAEIQSLKVAGADPADDKSYVCATSDFVVNQADKYLGLTPRAVNYTSTTVFQAMVAKVQREKTMNSQIENRFQEIH